MAEPQNIIATTIQQTTEHNLGSYTNQLPEVGWLIGVITAAVLGFGYVYSKFKKDTTVNSVEASLYQNLADRVEKISRDLTRVEKEREELIKKAGMLESRVLVLEKHEEENKYLRAKLDEKDKEIQGLQVAINKKQNEILSLNDRMAVMERKLEGYNSGRRDNDPPDRDYTHDRRVT